MDPFRFVSATSGDPDAVAYRSSMASSLANAHAALGERERSLRAKEPVSIAVFMSTFNPGGNARSFGDDTPYSELVGSACEIHDRGRGGGRGDGHACPRDAVAAVLHGVAGDAGGDARRTPAHPGLTARTEDGHVTRHGRGVRRPRFKVADPPRNEFLNLLHARRSLLADHPIDGIRAVIEVHPLHRAGDGAQRVCVHRAADRIGEAVSLEEGVT